MSRNNWALILSRSLAVLAVIMVALGTVFYMAGYFAGGFLIAGAAGVYLIIVRLHSGHSGLYATVRRGLKAMLVPLAGISIAIVAGAIIMALTGYDAIGAYRALFYGGLVKNWHVSVLNATPLIFTGLSVAFAFKAGLFNIGAEGQYYIGAMTASWLGLTLNLPAVLSLVLLFVIAGTFSAMWNIVPAFLKVRTGAHEVITTMMLAHTARYLSSIFIRHFGGNPSTSTHPYVTDEILKNNFLPRFSNLPLFENTNYRVHIGILVAILTAIFIYHILYKTQIGFEIRAVGQNKNAARAQGISIGKNIFRALLIAGALAGMAGVNQVTGLDHRLFENLQANYGWNGISVALLAGGSPVGVIFTSLLWGILDAGGQYMGRTTQTPYAIVEIVKGIILFLVVARHIYILPGMWWKRWMGKRAISRTVAGGKDGLL